MKKVFALGRLAAAFTMLFARSALCDDSVGNETAMAKRIAWFNEAKFGMFIHWGPFAVQGNDPEASFDYFDMKANKDLRAEFSKYAEGFHPAKFNAAQWMETARTAGMKYVVFTSKHHDGYCMFDSALTKYDAMDGAPKQDYVRELITAARAKDLKIGFYYSLLDWHEPDYEADLPKFVENYLFPQVRELCVNYGPIDCLWFDGEWDHPIGAWRGPELVQMIRALQPEALINDRLGKGERGANRLCDFYTREQPSEMNVAMPFEHQRPYSWEACMTIGGYWQFSRKDTRLKSTAELIGILVDVVSRGGNLLLNVGPTPDGEIPAPLLERLHGIGAWLETHGGAIYGTARSPFAKLPAGKCTAKGDRLFIFLDTPPSAPVALPGLQNDIQKAIFLETGAPVTFDNEKKTLSVPEHLPDAAMTVIAVELAGPPVVRQ